MPRSAPPSPRRRLSRLVTAGLAILATATLPAIFLPDAASADDVFNCYGTPFSEATYLSRYADVVAAVQSGAFASGCAHFAAHGHAEGRSGTPDGWQPPGGEPTSPPPGQPTYSPVFNCFGTPFSESVYLERYTEVPPLVASGQYSSGCDHFAQVGIHRGWSGTPDGWTPPSEPPTSPPAGSGKPTAAIALGDSFISGEGARDYQAVRGRDSDMHGFPGWNASNSNAYFCHRSANASIFRAQLDGIQDRFNIACSGGQPVDWERQSSERDRGRNVVSQRQQLIDVAGTHDIDLVLVGLGSNNTGFTFGSAALVCSSGFVSDAWFGQTKWLTQALKWATRRGDGRLPDEGPCDDNELATDDEWRQGEEETYQALRSIVATLKERDSDGQRRIVLQDYTNPLPKELHPEYHSEASAGRGFGFWETAERDDQRSKFRGLASERYEGGCPVHRASLAPAHRFSERLGSMVARNAERLDAEFPEEDIVYLNVQSAFNGKRLCETTAPPSEALATPLRLKSGPFEDFQHTLNGKWKSDLESLTTTCLDYYQTCQEGWHPNANGHGVLGQCLSFAARGSDSRVTCSRNPWTGEITNGPVQPPAIPPYEPPPCPENADDGQFERPPDQEQICPQ